MKLERACFFPKTSKAAEVRDLGGFYVKYHGKTV